MVISIFKDQSENERAQRAWERGAGPTAPPPAQTPMGTLDTRFTQNVPQQGGPAPQQGQGPLVQWDAPKSGQQVPAAKAPYMQNDKEPEKWNSGASQAGNADPLGQQGKQWGPLKANKILQDVEKTPREKAAEALAGTFSTREMTWDEYNALGDRQRATVDANTAILAAIEADRAEWDGKPRPEDTSEYDKTVAGLFGKGGGSDTYAPKTAAVLAALGISDTKTGDLDNYLNQTALVSDEDLAGLTDENIERYAGSKPLDTGKRDPRLANAVTFSGAAEGRLTDALSAGQTLLENLRGESAPIGFNPAEPTGRDAQLNALFEGMARRPGHPEGNLESQQVTNLYGEFQDTYGTSTDQIKNYFDRRLKQVEQGGDFALDASTYLSPEEFRTQFYTGGQ